MNSTILFLDNAYSWLRLADGQIVARGEGLEFLAGETVVAVAPPEPVRLFRAALGDLAPAQARAAARQLAGEASLSPIETLHVACGDPDDEGQRWVAVIETAHVADWLTDLAHAGIAIASLTPAALVPDVKANQLVRVRIGPFGVVRGQSLAFADDAALVAALSPDAAVADADPDEVNHALSGLFAASPLDLRQGGFAPRGGWHLGAHAKRRFGLMALAAGILALAIPVVEVIRLNRSSAALEAEALSLEAAALGPGPPALERLTAMRGPGAGFPVTWRVVSGAVQAAGTAELSSASFGNDGVLTASFHASAPADLESLKARLKGSGAQLSGGVVSGMGAQANVTFGVKAQ